MPLKPRPLSDPVRGILARTLNHAPTQAERAGRATAQAPLSLGDSAAGRSSVLSRRRPHYARLMADLGGGAYSVQEAFPTAAGTWDVPGWGRAGTAYELRSIPGLANAVVELLPGVHDDWRFEFHRLGGPEGCTFGLSVLVFGCCLGPLQTGGTATLSRTGYSQARPIVAGQAIFVDVPPGTYTLEVVAAGYPTQSRTVTLTCDTNPAEVFYLWTRPATLALADSEHGGATLSLTVDDPDHWEWEGYTDSVFTYGTRTACEDPFEGVVAVNSFIAYRVSCSAAAPGFALGAGYTSCFRNRGFPPGFIPYIMGDLFGPPAPGAVAYSLLTPLGGDCSTAATFGVYSGGGGPDDWSGIGWNVGNNPPPFTLLATLTVTP